MIVADQEEAQCVLSRINYYRLSGYWFPFLDQDQQRFRKNLRFSDIVQLYEYDRELRICLFESFTEIEVAIRALLGYELGQIDPLIYLEAERMGVRAIQYPRRPKGDNKPLKTKHELWIKRFNMVKDASKEAFVEHHIKNIRVKCRFGLQ